MGGNMIYTDPDKIVKKYAEIRPDYILFYKKIITFLTEVLESKKINIHSISGREKSLECFREKINRPGKNYTDPLHELTDLAGVRIITYYQKDVDKIAELINNEFEIDPENSIDKRKAADPSIFGYTSLHLIVSFLPKQLIQPEYTAFKDKKCEIQVRTILQHAWAQISHDTIYKTELDVPYELRRRFSSLAGLLEMADREFEVLNSYEDSVRYAIKNKIKNKDLNLPLSLISIQYYFEVLHNEKEIHPQVLRNFNELLAAKGITRIRQLDEKLSPQAISEADDRIQKDPELQKIDKDMIKKSLMRYFFAMEKEYANINNLSFHTSFIRVKKDNQDK